MKEKKSNKTVFGFCQISFNLSNGMTTDTHKHKRKFYYENSTTTNKIVHFDIKCPYHGLPTKQDDVDGQTNIGNVMKS